MMLPLSSLRSLYLTLGPGAMSGQIFADLCDQLLIREARTRNYRLFTPSDRAGDYRGLDAYAEGKEPHFEGFEGRVGFQYKFVPSETTPLSREHKQQIESSLKSAKQKNRDLKAWILITPEDFNTYQIQWLLSRAEELECNFPILHWGQKRLVSLISDYPDCARQLYPELGTGFDGVDWLGYCRRVTANLRREVSHKSPYIPLRLENGMIVDSVLAKFVASSDRVLSCILGGYGAGKTTVLETFAADIAEQFVRGSCERIPLLIRLRYVRGTGAFRHNIVSYLEAEYGIVISWDVLQSMIAEGRLVLLFDGLDEKESGEQRKHARIRIQEIFEFLSPAGKMIVSSRAEFFRSAIDEQEVLLGSSRPRAFIVRTNVIYSEDSRGEIHHLQLLLPSQIESYMQQRFGADYLECRARILSIYDLSDLITRPVLLDLVCETIPILQQSTNVSTSDLYELYTRLQFEADSLVSRSAAELDVKIRSVEDLAGTMFIRNQYRFREDELDVLLPETGEEPRDFLNTSLLQRDGQGYFEFSHRSLMEYFTARLAARYINGEYGESYVWAHRSRWTNEVGNFLAQILDREATRRGEASSSHVVTDVDLQPVLYEEYTAFMDVKSYVPISEVREWQTYAVVSWYDALAFAFANGFRILAKEDLSARVLGEWPTSHTTEVHSFFSPSGKLGPIVSKTGFTMVIEMGEWCLRRSLYHTKWIRRKEDVIPWVASLGPRASMLEGAVFRCQRPLS